jgi:hypothetical protein
MLVAVLAAVIVLAALTAGGSSTASGSNGSTTSASLDPSHWKRCVGDIGLYFSPSSETEFAWAPNPCGFRNMNFEDVQRNVFFRTRNRTVTFAGDSTALRAYIFAVNTYLPPLNIPVIRKVASVPRVMNNPLQKELGGEMRHVDMLFFNMRYISTSSQEVHEAIMDAPADGGAFVITIGNWDLNWKLQRNSPMPHLGGPVHDLRVAQRYWQKNVREMMQNIADRLRARRARGLVAPLIIFREQFLPNCAASRFTSKKNKYRRCAPLIRPVVVPYYRRLLSPVAWGMNIPVIPMDHIFKDDYKYCKLSDGIHLDQACMMTEQQHIWNVYDLLVRRNVVQGLPTDVNRVLDPAQFHDEAAFDKWMRDHGLAPPSVVASMPSASIAADSEGGEKGKEKAGDGAASSADLAAPDSVPRAAVGEAQTALSGHGAGSGSATGQPYAFSPHHFAPQHVWGVAGLVLVGATIAFSIAIFRDEN